VSEAVDYLLGELDPAETARFEAALERDAALRAEVERLRPVVTRLDALPSEAWAEVEPPPLREPWAAAESPAAGTPAPATGGESPVRRGPAAGAAPSRRRRSRRLVLRPAIAALAATALLAAGTGLGVLLDRDPQPATRLVLSPLDPADPQARGRVGVASDRVSLRVSGLQPTPEGQFYELWLLGADDQLIGLGAFRVDENGTATLRLPLPVDPERFRYFDISLEPGDGDPGHSGVSVLRGPTV
jgi:anti-sigma-K factor RskA